MLLNYRCQPSFVAEYFPSINNSIDSSQACQLVPSRPLPLLWRSLGLHVVSTDLYSRTTQKPFKRTFSKSKSSNKTLGVLGKVIENASLFPSKIDWVEVDKDAMKIDGVMTILKAQYAEKQTSKIWSFVLHLKSIQLSNVQV